MIVTRLNGGLGNQMFQYAAGYRFAKDRGTDLRLDISQLTDPARPYALGQFQITGIPLSDSETRKIQPSLPRLRRRFPWMNGLLPAVIPHIGQSRYSFEPDLLNSPAICYLDGYWQTEKYFETVADDIRRQFQLSAPMTHARQKIAEQIVAQNAISVHVRRGDYVSNAAASTFHGTCAPEWYDRATALMAQKTGSPHFFVFSDDPEWARANLSFSAPVLFVDPQSDKRDYEDMHLMALCRHNIIANSSFSWWGAWLNPNPDKQIIAPQRWFAQGHEDIQDLIPPSWIRL